MSILAFPLALAVFGALVSVGYIGHPTRDFRDSFLFPPALTLGGLAVIGAGTAYQKNCGRTEDAITVAVPDRLRHRLPRSRAV